MCARVCVSTLRADTMAVGVRRSSGRRPSAALLVLAASLLVLVGGASAAGCSTSGGASAALSGVNSRALRGARSLRASADEAEDLALELASLDGEEALEEASAGEDASAPAPSTASDADADASASAPVSAASSPDASSDDASNTTTTLSPEATASTATPPPPPPYVTEIGSLISYVDPPSGATVPALSPEAKAAASNLTGWYLGEETINANRQYTSSTAQSLNCGTGYLNEHFRRYFAAIPTTMWYDGQLCGACVNVTCVDTICPTPFTTYGVFQVVDSCEQCTSNNIVLSASGIGEVTRVNYDNNPSLQVAWTFVSCESYIEGGIKMLTYERNSKYFVGLNFSNLKVLLKSVSLSGITMTYESYGYWVIDTPGEVIDISPPYTLRLVSRNGEALAIRIPKLVPLDLGVNFTYE